MQREAQTGVAVIGAWLNAVLMAAPYGYMSWILLSSWRDPMAVEDGYWVRNGFLVFVIEFLTMHSSTFYAAFTGFFDDQRKRLMFAAGMFAFYGLFAVVFAAFSEGWWLTGAFVLMLASRGMGLVQNRNFVLVHAVRAGVQFLLFMLVCVMLMLVVPWPRWGVTKEVMAHMDFGSASGELVEQPWMALGALSVYFALLAVVELCWPLLAARLPAKIEVVRESTPGA